MKKIFITGGNGFVGCHIANYLAKKGYQVIASDISKRNVLLDAKVKFIRKDIRDSQLQRYLKGVSVVFHTAALIKIQESIRESKKYHDINVNGTLNLLNSAHKAGVKRIIYSSSVSVYGHTKKVPQEEEMLPEPQNPYAAQKLIGELYMNVWAHCYNIETVSLRYFSFYGLNQNSSGVIETFLKQNQKNKPLTVYGNGLQKQSFLYIDDLVDANYKAMLSSKVGRGEVINIGSNKLYAISAVAKLIGKKIIYRSIVGQAESSQPYEPLPSLKRAKKLLNWQPKTDLEEGIGLIKKTMEGRDERQ